VLIGPQIARGVELKRLGPVVDRLQLFKHLLFLFAFEKRASEVRDSRSTPFALSEGGSVWRAWDEVYKRAMDCLLGELRCPNGAWIGNSTQPNCQIIA